MDGIAATRGLRQLHPDTEVLVLTTYDTDADILRAIEAGAIGYLLKDATREELLEAARVAASGASAFAPSVASRLVDRVCSPARTALSAREIEILEVVAEGLTNRGVATRLHISEATVKTHLLHVFSKLGVNDRTKAVTEAVTRGIIASERRGYSELRPDGSACGGFFRLVCCSTAFSVSTFYISPMRRRNKMIHDGLI